MNGDVGGGDIADGAESVVKFFIIAFLLTALSVYLYSQSFQLTFVTLFASLTSVVWQFGLLEVLGYGLDPLAVLVALTAGGVVAGIIGVLLAVPLLAFLDHAVRSLLDSRETPPAQGGAVP